MALIFGASGVTPTLRGQASNVLTLYPGEAYLVPAGSWAIKCGRYTSLQYYDPVATFWRPIGGSFPGAEYNWTDSDGNNTRVVNQSGCAVGALLTNGGSGYTTVPTITASAGNSKWTAILGGAVSTTVTVNNGGTNYNTYPPIVLFSAPPTGGIQAEGYATISAGAVSTIVVTNQGAGYTSAPTIQIVNDPRDTTGSGATATATLTGAGTVTGVICTDHGTALAAGAAAPTLTFSSGSAAATALMCWTILGYTVTSAGNSYASPVAVTALPGTLAASAYTNPTTQANLVRYRKADLLAALSGNVITGTGQTVLDGGIYYNTPTALIQTNQGPTTAASLGFTLGGAVDTVILNPV